MTLSPAGRKAWPRIVSAAAIVVLIGVLMRVTLAPHQSTAGTADPTVTPATRAPFALPASLSRYHIAVTDLASGDVALLGQTTLVTGGGPHGLGLQPGGRWLWVSNVNGQNVWLVDLEASGGPRVAASITVGLEPVHFAFSPDGQTAYVTDFGTDTVTVVDVAARKAVAQITTGKNPHGIAITPDGRWLYVACYGSGELDVIATTTRQVVDKVPLPSGADPYGVAISPDGQRVYVSNYVFGQLLAVSTTTRQVVASVQVGARPMLVAWVPGANLVAVADNASGTVTLVDAATLRIVATIVTGVAPHGVAASPDGSIIAVANTGSNTVTIVGIHTRQVIAQIPVGQFSNDVLITLASS